MNLAWMILPGKGEMTVPATSAAAPWRSHLQGIAFLNLWQLPSSHMLTIYKNTPQVRSKPTWQPLEVRQAKWQGYDKNLPDTSLV